MNYLVISPFDMPPAGIIAPGTSIDLSDDYATPLREAGFIKPAVELVPPVSVPVVDQ